MIMIRLVVNLATITKSVKSKIFLHKNIHRYTKLDVS